MNWLFRFFRAGWWGAAEAVIPDTPTSRQFTVEAEDRGFVVEFETRSFTP